MGKITDVGLDPKAADNRIIAAALGCAEKNDTLLVSNDTALRVKAMKLGVPAQEWVPVKVERARVGWQEVDVTGGLIDDVYSSRSVPVEDAVKSSEKMSELIVNEGAVLRFGTQSALVRLRSDGRLHLVDTQPFWNLKPRTAEQKFAGDLLRDPGVQIVALDGRAG